MKASAREPSSRLHERQLFNQLDYCRQRWEGAASPFPSAPKLPWLHRSREDTRSRRPGFQEPFLPSQAASGGLGSRCVKVEPLGRDVVDTGLQPGWLS